MLLSILLSAFAGATRVSCSSDLHSIVEPLLTAELPLDPPIGPIAVPRGARIIEPIPAGGRIAGAINGSITAGVVAPVIYGPLSEPDFISVSDTYLWGTIDNDGGPFYVQTQTIGRGGNSVGRLLIEAGGDYQYLQGEFVFARIVSDLETGQATLEAFRVHYP